MQLSQGDRIPFILFRWRGRVQELTLGLSLEKKKDSLPTQGGDQERLELWVLATPHKLGNDHRIELGPHWTLCEVDSGSDLYLPPTPHTPTLTSGLYWHLDLWESMLDQLWCPVVSKMSGVITDPEWGQGMQNPTDWLICAPVWPCQST